MSEDTQAHDGATIADIETSLLRPLTAVEAQYASALLARAFSLIEAAAGPATEWTPEYWSIVAVVQADMVARRLRNPEGKYSEGDGQYSFQLDRTVASGKLELTDADREQLGLISHGLFIWMPQYGEESTS